MLLVWQPEKRVNLSQLTTLQCMLIVKQKKKRNVVKSQMKCE